METLIVVLVVIAVVLLLKGVSSKKREPVDLEKIEELLSDSRKRTKAQENVRRKEQDSSSNIQTQILVSGILKGIGLNNTYNPGLVGANITKTLENIYIFENSKNVDIIVGRYQLLMESVANLTTYSKHERYTSDMQLGLDHYKMAYYDRIPSKLQLQAISDPSLFNSEILLKMSLSRAIVDYYYEQSESIKALKLRSAISNRKSKIIEKCVYIKDILSRCDNKSGLDDIYCLIDKIIEYVNNDMFDEKFNLDFSIS